MSKKLFTLMAVVILATMILTACGGAAADDCASEDVLCIGLVTDVGEVDDKSFNQSAWEGAQAAAEAHGAAKVEYIETKDAKDYGANMQLFLDEGYDVIITVGFAMGEATDIAAAANPNAWFIGVDQWPSGDNVNFVGLVFNEDHSGFLAGALAASMTESNILAAVLGTDLIPPVVAFKEGYEAGAAYINPDISLISTYHPGGMDIAFTDPEWGATTAAQAIDNGADVVFGAGGKTGNGALIEAAGYDGVFCIGVDSDQWETVPEAHPCLISSAMKLITPGIVDMIDLYVAGNAPEFVFFGGAGLAPFHDFDTVIPADVKTMLEDLAAGLADGSVSTGYGQ
jgi:basic membrane protein A